MVRVDIETVVMAGGPVPSVIVLRERTTASDDAAPRRALSIQTGAYEAAAVSRGIDHPEGDRPITHDLLLDVVDKLGARLERVEIDRVDAPVFYATLVIRPDAAAEMDASDPAIRVDARPTDALALAVRANAPIFVEDDVMNRAGRLGSSARSDRDDEAEIERFDEFVKTLSPDDF